MRSRKVLTSASAPPAGPAIALLKVLEALHLPIDDFLAMHDQPLDADTRALLEPLVTHLALCRSVNATWAMLALACIVPVVACAVPLIHGPLIHGLHRRRASGTI